MEIMAIEFGDGFERVWSDYDPLLWDETGETHRDAPFSRHADISLKNVMIGDCFERAWFDVDDVLLREPRPLSRIAA